MSQRTEAKVGDNHKIVCLCGFTRFKRSFDRAERDLTLQGKIVLTPGVYEHADGVVLSDKQRRELDALQLKKIDMSDCIYVINFNSQTNDVTEDFIKYARSKGKEVYLMFDDSSYIIKNKRL